MFYKIKGGTLVGSEKISSDVRDSEFNHKPEGTVACGIWPCDIRAKYSAIKAISHT